MKKQFIFCVLATAAVIFLNSCTPEIEPLPETPALYWPMSVGNYWIYQHYKIDSLGNELPFRTYIDSVYIVKDSVIRGKKYYKFENSIGFEKFQGFFRDSCGYLINSTGEIYFSATNFTDTISSDYGYNKPYRPNRLLFYTLKTKMNPAKQVVNTPSNSYNALVADGFITFYYYNEAGDVTDTIATSLNTYFAPNIGMVKDTYRYYLETKHDKVKIERRLLRYNIQE
ncbi:MAG: hypothetical protein BGP01_09540 [Paludibacter sp. 47-17]|nr:MAG: hypothetical protein BGP01_09540 [Paludibacter sp. 47-17]